MCEFSSWLEVGGGGGVEGFEGVLAATPLVGLEYVMAGTDSSLSLPINWLDQPVHNTKVDRAVVGARLYWGSIRLTGMFVMYTISYILCFEQRVKMLPGLMSDSCSIARY